MIRLGVKICLNYLLFIIIKLLSDAAPYSSLLAAALAVSWVPGEEEAGGCS